MGTSRTAASGGLTCPPHRPASASSSGRLPWYACAYYLGLRKGELLALRWSDVNIEGMTMTVRNSKAKRTEVIALHPALVPILRGVQPATRCIGDAKVFPHVVTDATRRRDFERAGIPQTDEDGRSADLHALRTTLGTDLALHGVAPQLAQKIMRHSNYQTTLKHYTVLGLTDTATALAVLPKPIPRAAVQTAAMTGTDSVAPVRARGALSGAFRCNPAQTNNASASANDAAQTVTGCSVVQGGAPEGTKAGEGDRTLDIQLGKLTLYH